MEDEVKTEAQTIADLGAAATHALTLAPNAKPCVMLPPGYSVHDLEHMLPAPSRKGGRITVRDAASFVAMVASEATDNTRLYRTVKPPQFTAIIDDDTPAGPGWGDYRIVYDCPLSPEWVTWAKFDKHQMQQEQFAQFIEDNLPDIIEPAGAQMLEIALSLQAKKKVNFASGTRLDNGQNQLTYEESIEGSAGAKGHLKIPAVFVLAIPVFEGGALYKVDARLRYRISDKGGLTLWYDLERPHKIVEHAVEQLRVEIEEKTGRKTINGGR